MNRFWCTETQKRTSLKACQKKCPDYLKRIIISPDGHLTCSYRNELMDTLSEEVDKPNLDKETIGWRLQKGTRERRILS